MSLRLSNILNPGNAPVEKYVEYPPGSGYEEPSNYGTSDLLMPDRDVPSFPHDLSEAFSTLSNEAGRGMDHSAWDALQEGDQWAISGIEEDQVFNLASEHSELQMEWDSENLNGLSREQSFLDQEMLDPSLEDIGSAPEAKSSNRIDQDTQMVCYGMLYKQDAKLIQQNMPALNDFLDGDTEMARDNLLRLTLSVKSDPAHMVLLSLEDGSEFGYLNENVTRALDPLIAKSSLEFEAIGEMLKIREQIQKAANPQDAVAHLEINIYGPRKEAAAIGEALSCHKLWLQSPDNHKKHLPYENPHKVSFDDIGQIQDEDLRKEISGASKQVAEGERLKTFVSEVHDRLNRANNLDRTTGDQRLRTDLLEHQERALSYMLKRESGKIEDEFRLWQKGVFEGQETYIHRVTKTRSPTRPDERGGGVLADEMGMGKSLSALSLILKTIADGQKWADEEESKERGSSKLKGYTRSTLIIVPSALLINNWLHEVKQHTKKAQLEVIKYHGQTRKKELKVLKGSDMVITTYSTLATEQGKDSVLNKIGWYRIILDEAHYIRHKSTTFFRSCADLEARSRWCLTGTPIQNRLEDIGTLFAFLRAEPFHSLSHFRYWICMPFDRGEIAARDRLILLYDSLVLRRTKNILKLPEHNEEVISLEFTSDERIQYQQTTKILERYMQTQVSNHAHYKAWETSRFGIFQLQLQQRILCNHGTYQKPFSWKKRDLRDEKEALKGALGLESEAYCGGCNQPYSILATESNFVEQCTHVLCHECIENLSSLPGADQDMSHCPLCQRPALQSRSAQGRAHNMDDESQMQDDDNGDGNPQPRKQADYFRDKGISTKIKRLIVDVKKAHQDERKSIIFTCWTKTLNLIAKHLEDEGIECCRIDGETPPSKRQQIIDKYSDDRNKNLRVLLMTTGTGAFGLNLTAANRIFIVEPQWNPSVENQAVARAIRLRQTRTVAVTKYVIKDTVEELMQKQQIRKRVVAAFGFEREPAESCTDPAEPDVEMRPAENETSVTNENVRVNVRETRIDLTAAESNMAPAETRIDLTGEDSGDSSDMNSDDMDES